MAHFYPQSLQLLVLITVLSECRGRSPATETFSAFQEGDVVLPCFDTNDKDLKCYRVVWVKYVKYATDVSQKVILSRPKLGKNQDAAHVKWEADENGQMSLFLTKLQKSDEGLYSCEIWEGWDRTFVRNISLRVKECKTLQPVKVAPSTLVNLTCPVDLTSGQQEPRNISWAMLRGGKKVYTEWPTKVEIDGTSLAIQSVSSTDSGWYSCEYMLGQTQRCFEINLLIQEKTTAVTTTAAVFSSVSEVILEARKEESSGAFIAIVASAFIGTAVIAALIGLFIYRRRTTQRVTHVTQRHRPGATIDALGVYETAHLTLSSDASENQQVNSLYQQFDDEALCTFHYK
ncbi:hypothetical protein L3Q82_013147 [Scortum barcoo]|uniref:Uncharacterized protein n=1 Tax=Scortum barcoo TaxID=214431 RepID=A0ACB8W169_9TELE|nr:hypothetical protein L3Q82_013147 [Scortum barcoo]